MMISITREAFAIITAFVCIIAFIALLANAAVILAFIRSGQLRQPSNYFAVNLAITDICIIIGPLSLWMLIVWHNYTLFVFQGGFIVPFDAVAPFYKFWTFLDATLLNVSVTNLAFLSLERYFAIVMPIRHRVHLTSRKIQLACIVTWLMSLIIMAPSLVFDPMSVKRYIHKAMPALICCLIMIVSYVLVLRKVYTKTRFNRQVNIRQQRKNRREMILSLRLSLLTVAFLVCWTPITILSFLVASHKNQINISIEISYIVTPILKLFSYAHSFLNPFLYVFGRPAFARVLKGIFCCKKLSAVDAMATSSTEFSRRVSKDIETRL